MTRIVFFKVLEESEESFFVICIRGLFLISVEDSRLVRKVNACFFYMGFKGNLFEWMLWVEAFIRNPVLVTTCTSKGFRN